MRLYNARPTRDRLPRKPFRRARRLDLVDATSSGCPAGRLADLDLPAESRRAGRRGPPACAGCRPSSSSARTIRPLVALLKWLTTLRRAVGLVQHPDRGHPAREVGRRPPERGVRRGPEVDQQAVARRLCDRRAEVRRARCAATAPSPGRRRPRRAGRPGSGRPAGAARTVTTCTASPAWPARRRSGGRESAEAERVVQHAGVDPVGARRRRREQRRRCAATSVRRAPGRQTEDRSAASGSASVQSSDERGQHPLARSGEDRGRQRGRGPARLPRRGAVLPSRGRQQDQHRASLGRRTAPRSGRACRSRDLRD